MASLSVEILMILLLVVINGLLALAEFALVSVRKARLQQLSDQGDEKARVALEIAREPGEFLSTIQIGITLVGVLAGAFGGATISKWLAEQLSQAPLLAPFSQGLALGLVVIVITLLTLVLGELVPKRLALSRPEMFALAFARPMRLLSSVMRPVVRLLNGLTELVLRLLKAPATIDASVTEEEIRVLIDQATEAGIFEEAEQDMLSGVLRLGDRRVGNLITPRTEIEWLDLEDPPQVNVRKVIESPHTRFPVGYGSLDDIRGIAQARAVLAADLKALRTGSELELDSLLLPPVFVPENKPALEALELFRSARASLLLVIDEFGGLQGLVTIADVLESVVGDIPLTAGASDQEVVVREDGSLLIDGLYPVDEFLELFDLATLPGYDKGLFQSLGGFVMNYLGRIPSPGDHFEWQDMRFEVVDMDGLRIDKILVEKSVSGGPAQDSES
jgi:putative hemolysin